MYIVDETKPWIGVDLDGTLAHFDWKMWKKHGLRYIGLPIPPMLNRVKAWIANGKRVKIFTARVASKDKIEALHNIQRWLYLVGLPNLEITNSKDWMMEELWDDRCIQVVTNTGIPVNGVSVPVWDPDEDFS